MRPGPIISLTPAQEYLERLLREAGRVDLVAIIPGGPIARGVFDAPHWLRTAIDDNREHSNLYTTIQAPKPQAATNKLEPHGRGLGNDDIGHYIRIPFDLDVVRPTDTAATRAQVDDARDVADRLRRMMYQHGWPLPALIHSGSGWHLMYRTPPIPVSDDIREQLRIIYRGLAAEIDSAQVKLDQTVRNPGRIMRLPGSLNMKGGERHETQLEMPVRWRQVAPRDIERLAHFYSALQSTPQPSAPTGSTVGPISFEGNGDYASLDVVAWFGAHGHYLHPIEENKHAVRCPWHSEHTSTGSRNDSIVYEIDGSWPGFYCHHAHCEGRDIRQVLEIWGDGDRFCSRRFKRGARS
jgi:hypothetical protein